MIQRLGHWMIAKVVFVSLGNDR